MDFSKFNALILCAGLGTRLRPITDTTPKPMVEVAGKPIVLHLIEKLNKSGIKRIAINTHYLPEKLKEGLGNKVTYFFERKLLGTAGTLMANIEWLGRDFLVINGDTLSDIEYRDFIRFHTHWREIASVSRDKNNDKCTGTMMFNRKIKAVLPKEGMIDDILEEVMVANYYKCDKYFDCGTIEGLERARRYYATSN